MKDEKRRHILKSALAVFFKYGYKRISMQEIADAAGISRQGLYLYFKTREDVFNAALEQYTRDMIAEIEHGIHTKKTAEDKLMHVFDIWVISTFDDTQKSPEAKEIRDFPPEFAKGTVLAGYKAFEAVLASILKEHAKSALDKKSMSAEKAAHFLLSGMLGFKLIATSSQELRRMIRDLVKAIIQ